MNTYKLGIDIGSTTVKIAILDENNQILFSDYERHFANITAASGKGRRQTGTHFMFTLSLRVPAV